MAEVNGIAPPYLLFRLGGGLYAVDAAAVRELFPLPELKPVAEAPPYRWEFTEGGREQARAVVRRVRPAEVLLERTLDRAPAECGRETPVAAGFEDQVCAFLDHPERCPHGRAIPPGEGCCATDSFDAFPRAAEVRA